MVGLILVPLEGSEAAEAALAVAKLIPSHSVHLLAVESMRLSAAAGDTIGMKEHIHGIRGYLSKHPRSARRVAAC